MIAALPDTSGVQQVLAFDFGTQRTGVATGSVFFGRGQPLRTIVAQGEPRFSAIAALVEEWQPGLLLVGVPLHPDGAPHENTVRARRFARQLAGRFKLPVREIDERYSTTEALASGAKDADAASAVILLEQFFRERAL
jgi:putative Holliday junction resolvase